MVTYTAPSLDPDSRDKANATQYVGKPGLRIDAVEFCRSDEGVCRGSALTASVGAGE